MVRSRAILWVLLGASSYGLLSPLVKMAYLAGYNPEEVTMAQFLVALVLVAGISLIYRKEYAKLNRKTVMLLVLLGSLATGTSILYYEALQVLEPSIGIVLLFQFSWIVLVLDSMVRKRWPSLVQWVSVIFILLGTACAVGLVENWSQISSAVGTKSGIGYLLGFGSAFSYALFLYLTERLHADVPAVVKSSVLNFASTLVCIAVFPATFASLLQSLVHPHLATEALSYIVKSSSTWSVSSMPKGPGLWGWALWIGLFGQLIPPMLFSLGIPVIGGALAGVLGAVELPVAILSSWFLLKDPVTLMQWVGILFILAGIVLPEWYRNRFQKNTFVS